MRFCRDDDQWLASFQSLGKKPGDRLGKELLRLIKLKDVTGSDASAEVIVAAEGADVARVHESIKARADAPQSTCRHAAPGATCVRCRRFSTGKWYD